MRTYAILYHAFGGGVEVITVPGLNSEDARSYALEHYSHLITERNFIKAVYV